MMEEEGWTALQLGVLSSVQFWTYGLGHLVNGRLGEVFGVNRLIMAGMILSAAMNISDRLPVKSYIYYYPLGIQRLLPVDALVAWHGASVQLVAWLKERIRNRIC